MRTQNMIYPLLIAAASIAITNTSMGPHVFEYTSDFGLDQYTSALASNLTPDGSNTYFTLQPGTFYRYEGVDEGEFVELEHTVLNETIIIPFTVRNKLITATARIMEEREWRDGELVEVALNYFAFNPASGSIFFFGEDVDIYKNGEVISNEGSWRAGVNYALPGLYMPGLFLLGSRYYQEIAPGVAMDRSEHIAMGVTIETPLGIFTDCVVILDTDPFDPDEETLKVYARGIGLVADGTLELVEFKN